MSKYAQGKASMGRRTGLLLRSGIHKSFLQLIKGAHLRGCMPGLRHMPLKAVVCQISEHTQPIACMLLQELGPTKLWILCLCAAAESQ